MTYDITTDGTPATFKGQTEIGGVIPADSSFDFVGWAAQIEYPKRYGFTKVTQWRNTSAYLPEQYTVEEEGDNYIVTLPLQGMSNQGLFIYGTDNVLIFGFYE